AGHERAEVEGAAISDGALDKLDLRRLGESVDSIGADDRVALRVAEVIRKRAFGVLRFAVDLNVDDSRASLVGHDRGWNTMPMPRQARRAASPTGGTGSVPQ